MAEIASAYVTLIPSAEGFGRKTTAVIGPEVKSSGSKVGSLLGGALKGAALATTATLGGLLATAITKGFTRLEAIDQAEAKLTGLGHSAKTVDKIMANALASVKGTAFGLGDAATVSASAVAAGIKPGRDLTKTLKLVADAATIGGSSLTEMGAIFNKVAASNKIQGDVINQLNDQGIPIIQLLGKQLGVTSAEVTELASRGEIDFETFRKAMAKGLGGAAKESGNTFSGALANVGASLSRVGAGLLGGIFPHLAPMFQGITKALEPLEGKSKQLGDAIGKRLGPALEQVGPFLSKIITGLTNFNAASAGGSAGNLASAFEKLGGAIASIDFGALLSAFGQGAADTVSVFAVVVGFLANHLDLLAKVMPGLIVAFAAFQAAQAASRILAVAHVPLTVAQTIANISLANSNRALAAQMAIANGVEQQGILLRTRGTISLIASKVATVAVSAATKAYAAVQWLLNAALTANPIGLVVVALAALGAALVIAYKKSETFRNIVDGALSAVKGFFTDLASKVADFVGDWKGKLGDAVEFVKGVPGKIKDAFGDAKGILIGIGRDIIQGLIDGITDKVDDLKGLLNKVTGLIPDWKGPMSKDAVLLRPTGQAIMGGLIDGIGDRQADLKKKLEEQTQTIIDTLKSRLSSLRSAMSSVASSVASAFTPDVFGGTAADLSAGLTSNVGNLRAVIDAFKKLKKIPGMSPAFLSQLFASGNTGLILELANDPTLAAQDSKLFTTQTNLSDQLGQMVGGNQFGDRIDKVREEIRGLRKDLKQNAKDTGDALGAALNGAAGDAIRRRRRGLVLS